jgi:hypothetical protein
MAPSMPEIGGLATICADLCKLILPLLVEAVVRYLAPLLVAVKRRQRVPERDFKKSSVISTSVHISLKSH